jgi:hypothetical protein
MKLNKKALLFSEALKDVMNEEIGVDRLEATEDFTAILLGVKYLFNILTSQDLDIIDITHMLNKLAVLHVLDEEEEK